MIRVLFFARLREQLDCSRLELSAAEPTLTVQGLRRQLMGRGDAWRVALANENLICAVNQQVVVADQDIADGDEVAFYPPVTGG